MNQVSATADFATVSSPAMIGRGIAFGVMLGLIPKDNLTAVLMAGATFLLPIHRPSSWICVLAVSLAFWGTDPWIGLIGERMLSSKLIGSALGTLSELPILAWCSMNNTVVLGGLAFGCATYPLTSFVVRRIVQRIQYVQLQRQVDSLILRAIEQSEDLSSTSSMHAEIDAETPSQPDSSVNHPFIENSNLILRIDTKIETPEPRMRPHQEQQSASNPETVEPREKTEFLPPPKHIARVPGVKPPQDALSALPIGGFLQETRIEITRFRKERIGTAAENSSLSRPAFHATISKHQEEPDTVQIVSASDQFSQSESAYQVIGARADSREQNVQARDQETNIPTNPGMCEAREESLRFLLWHLSHREHRG